LGRGKADRANDYPAQCPPQGIQPVRYRGRPTNKRIKVKSVLSQDGFLRDPAHIRQLIFNPANTNISIFVEKKLDCIIQAASEMGFEPKETVSARQGVTPKGIVTSASNHEARGGDILRAAIKHLAPRYLGSESHRLT